MDFTAIQRRLREQSERYRDRHISAKLTLYSGFFAFDGLTLAAAAIAANTPSAHWIIIAVVAMSMVSAAILFLQFHWILTLYDALGFSKISIQSEEDIEKHYERDEQQLIQFRRRKFWRRSLDLLLFVLALTQAALIMCAVR